MKVWSVAIAAGIPNELFWECTSEELEALLEEIRNRRREEARQATLNAALIAATIVNVNRRPGTRMVQPSDFIVELPKPEDYMKADDAHAFMDRWAANQNAMM